MCIFSFLEARDRYQSRNMPPVPIATYEHQLKFERDAQTRPYTEYARKFGPKSPDRAQGKSWLTPLDPLFPVNWEDKRPDDRHNIIGGYQKQELLLFTTRELKDLDAICDRPLRDSTLSGGILPILQRDRWEDKPSDAWLRTDSVPIVSSFYFLSSKSPLDKILLEWCHGFSSLLIPSSDRGMTPMVENGNRVMTKSGRSLNQ